MPIRVLVVDDDEAGRYVKAHSLANRGCAVSEAALGAAAIDQIQASPPDVVVLDVKLPDIDGITVCRQIKAAFPQVAVLQTSSAFVSPQDRAAALDGGADSYLIEPIDPDELIAVVRALFRMREAEQELRQLNETLEARVIERAAELAEANRQLAVEQGDRRRAEEILWHTQKLEAVGQLTGGVAHDFNNLLTVITGNLELLEEAIVGNRELPPESRLKLVRSAQGAAERGAQLTQQLLAFAGRGALRSATVNLNTVIAGFADFQRRVLGETIALNITYAPDLWPCQIDPVQFEAAILNLVVNARYAMPNGGKLRIETGNLKIGAVGGAADYGLDPGAYVWVRVSDTGVGMEPDVLRRAFDPFFTTREVGQGSGLGLSQVYGFVTQSAGRVTVKSAPGAGAIFTLHFPVATEAAPKDGAAAQESAAPGTGAETILVVEDNDEVLTVAVTLIRGLGYNVLAVADGVKALALLREGARVDLLFSDVVMPHGVGGVVLATKALAICKDLKILLTSGYPAMRGDSSALSAFPFIRKPYRRDDLARMLRTTLDAGASPPHALKPRPERNQVRGNQPPGLRRSRRR